MTKARIESEQKRSIRTTVSIPANDYSALEALACRMKVSVAWVVRDAIEEYLATHRPGLVERESQTAKPARK